MSADPEDRADAGKPTRVAPAAGKTSIGDVDELMIYAYAMENEAAERYTEFADAMETHNNREVAELFRKLARIENIHAQQIVEAMSWNEPPAPPLGGFRWLGLEGPESGDHSDLHYLMQPYHALTIARQNEERAQLFYAAVAAQASDAKVRASAAEMAEEEAEHVHLIEQWLERTPKPDPHWARDDDPPVLGD